ncbi:MAG: MliC family protein [Chroococcidiopsidaceae cyanobacterium CP_BM_RX_35]|nr:MliC family protein [Chroococcidiopsidaceae cyanobacterium CP_BM_RX_35]
MSPSPTGTSEPTPTLSPSTQPIPNRMPPPQQPSGTSTLRSFKYKCAQGKSFRVDFEASKAVVLFDTGKAYLFRQVESGSRIRYANGDYMLYGKGKDAYIEHNQKRLYDKCVAQPLSTRK